MKNVNVDSQRNVCALLMIILFVGFGSSCSDSLNEDDVLIDVSDADASEDDTDDPGNGDEGDSTDENNSDNNDSDTQDDGCDDPNTFVFNEQDGLVNVEFETAAFSGDWIPASSESGFSGAGYMVWTGEQSLGQPGNGLTTYLINITTSGTYRFLWRSAVTIGDNGTEHNDTWLRFNDADDFFGQKGDNSFVYPNGSGKTPNPEGASKDGWFKIYRSGNDLGFKWQARTSDNDAHDIYVTFDAPGTYTMEISARSSGHAIDRFVLFHSDMMTAGEATDDANALSAISCDD
ncbi:MAG: hypothetical protein AAGB24_02395 [Bacteroidota bacterium]